MKVPNPWRFESALRRVLDGDRFGRLIYFEEAVLADPLTGQQKGYYLFVILDDCLLYVGDHDKKLPAGQSLRLQDVADIEALSDPAHFFSEEAAAESQHIRITSTATSASSSRGLLDLFTFYEDSKLFHFLESAWLGHHTKQAMTAFFPAKQPRVAALQAINSAVLLEKFERDLKDAGSHGSLAEAAIGGGLTEGDGYYMAIKRKVRIFEELAVAVAANKFFKKCVFDSPFLLSFMFGELRALNEIRDYLFGNAKSVLNQRPHILIEDERIKIKYFDTLLQFVSNLLLMSDAIPERVNFLQPEQPSAFTAIVNALLLIDSNTDNENTLAQADRQSKEDRRLRALQQFLAADPRANQREAWLVRQRRRNEQILEKISGDRRKMALWKEAKVKRAREQANKGRSQSRTVASPKARAGRVLGAEEEDDRNIDEMSDYEVQLENADRDQKELINLKLSLNELDLKLCECLYHLMGLLNYFLTIRHPARLNTETLFNSLMQRSAMEFRAIQIPLFFHRLFHLLTLPQSALVGYHIHTIALVLARFVSRSSEIRSLIKQESLLEFLYQPAPPSPDLTRLLASGGVATPSAMLELIDDKSNFFYKKAKKLIESIIQQVQQG